MHMYLELALESLHEVITAGADDAAVHLPGLVSENYHGVGELLVSPKTVQFSEGVPNLMRYSVRRT